MFERPTVFIIGAGASSEAKLPLGNELTTNIAASLNFNSITSYQLTRGDPCIFEAAGIKRSIDKFPHFPAFIDAGRSISRGMIQAISIDNYLHAHADNPTIVWMGKLAVAQCILQAEAKSLLTPHRDQRKEKELPAVKGTWFNVFFQMLHEGIQQSTLEKIFENISIITFNYDRSIEHFLMLALMNYYEISASHATKLLGTLRIEHPYGQVGRLPWQGGDDPVEYGQEADARLLHKIANQIRTFTERIENDDMILRARNLIRSAEVVVFLGFSYGRMNMELLEVKLAAASEVYGTSYGISDPNKSVIHVDIKNTLRNAHSPLRQIDLANLSCKQFLENYREPILRGAQGNRTRKVKTRQRRHAVT